MKMTKRLFTLLVLVTSLFLFTAAPVSISTVHAASVTMSRSLNSGESFTVRVSPSGKKVTWKSSNTSVASFSTSGKLRQTCKITAKKPGSAKISAVYGKTKHIISIKVRTPKLNCSAFSLNIGSKLRLRLSNASGKIAWKSTNTKVATCKNGLVTATGNGTCYIYATHLKKNYKCKITVRKSYLSKTSLDLEVNQEYRLNLINGGDKISWKSSDSSVAVCNDGYVTAVGKGTCTITATCGKKVYKCSISVKAPHLSENEITLETNQSYQLNLLDGGEVSYWGTNNSWIASIKDGLVQALQVGTTEVYAEYNGNFYKCKVTVTESTAPGSRLNPLSAKTSYTGPLYYYGDLLGSFTVQLLDYRNGTDASTIVLRNPFNKVPNADYEEYIYIKFKISYLSGAKPIRLSNIFFFNSLYDSSGTKPLDILNYGVNFEDCDDFNGLVYPGDTCTASGAVLVVKGSTPVTYTFQTKALPDYYTWYSTAK